MRSAADWLGRTLLLVLAGLATLSLIASIASVSNIHDAPSRVAEVRPDAPPGEPGIVVVEESGEGVLSAISASDPQDGDVARWLESLTYAVLALAGFMAAAVIVLLRITALLARIAER